MQLEVDLSGPNDAYDAHLFPGSAVRAAVGAHVKPQLAGHLACIWVYFVHQPQLAN